MGAVKNLMMEYEAKVDEVHDLFLFLERNKDQLDKSPRISFCLKVISDNLKKLFDLLEAHSNDIGVMSHFCTCYEKEIEECTELAQDLNSSKGEKFHYEQLKCLIFLTDKIYTRLNAYCFNHSTSTANSEEYYTNKINEIEQEKEKLKLELKTAQNSNNKRDKDQQETIKQLLKSIEEKGNAINELQHSLEEKKKQDDANTEWKTKISSTFDTLKNNLSPIKEEHSRLKILYMAYAFINILTFLGLAIWFGIFLFKILHAPEKYNYIQHLIHMSPFSILAGILWASIYQMNRAQRQMVVLAKHIHEIEYTEGLLLGINSLSSDMNDSIKRVNSAMDKLLENHLSLEKDNCQYDENSITKEERKDSIPIEQLMKILKEVKCIATKN